MTTQDDGGPAFPIVHQGFGYSDGSSEHASTIAEGMSLRDWFAGMALQALLSDPSRSQGSHWPTSSFHLAWFIADGMLETRATREKVKP